MAMPLPVKTLKIQIRNLTPNYLVDCKFFALKNQSLHYIVNIIPYVQKFTSLVGLCLKFALICIWLVHFISLKCQPSYLIM